jgi:hypothetical protein
MTNYTRPLFRTLKAISLLVILSIFSGNFIYSQTYEIDAFDGQTITTCGGTFTDSDPSTTGNYGNNENYTVTFCSGNASFLTFDFDVTGFFDPLSSGDTLYMYDGNNTSGDLIMQIDGTDDPSFSEFMLSTLSTCVTFQFISDGSTNNDGWAANISCTTPPNDCNGNPAAADIAAQAPFICNLDGYCGNTGAYYHEDLPQNLIGTGGNCPSAQAFLGTIQNNSWLIFEANATNVNLNFTVSGCGGDGIQAAIMQYNGTNWVRYSDCASSDGGNSGTFTLSAAGMTPGENYYIMVDGNAGSNCDYTINVSGNGVAVLDSGIDQEICPGDDANVFANGPTGASYIWNALDGSVTNASGAAQTFTPETETTYVVEIIGGGICENQTDTIVITMCSQLPIELKVFLVNCELDNNTLYWETYSELNNDYFIIERAYSDFKFHRIAKVPGQINSSALSYYNFSDPIINKEIVYYKLAQVDFNGNYTHLKTINISESCINNPINSNPPYYNPISNSINISCELSEEIIINYYLVDIAGRIIEQSEKLLQNGTNELKIDEISDAVYFLILDCPLGTFKYKLIIAS